MTKKGTRKLSTFSSCSLSNWTGRPSADTKMKAAHSHPCLMSLNGEKKRRSSDQNLSQTTGGSNTSASSSLLTTDTLQAHYNYFQQSHQQHHPASSSSCDGGLSCHSPGSCPTCDNNVVPHFHTYVPEVPEVPEVPGIFLLDTQLSIVSRSSSASSLRHLGDGSVVDEDVTTSCDDSSSGHVAPAKHWIQTLTSSRSTSGDSSRPTSPRAGGTPSGSSLYDESSGGQSAHASSSLRESRSRTTVELLSYRVRIAIDKSLYRINELHELARRVIVIAVDGSVASKHCLGWCRKHLIKQDSDIVVILSVWEEFTKAQSPSFSALNSPGITPEEIHKMFREEAEEHNRISVVKCKKMIGHYYKEHLPGCDVYPLLLPVDKSHNTSRAYDADSTYTDSTGQNSGGSSNRDGHHAQKQHLKSAIASVMCRATNILRAEIFVLGCTHAHKYPNTYVTSHTDSQCSLVKLGRLGGAFTSDAKGTVNFNAGQKGDLNDGNARSDSQVPLNDKSLASTVCSTLSLPLMKHSASTPYLMNYHNYLKNGGTSAASVIRRLFRGSVSHFLLKNLSSTCTVVLVRTQKSCKEVRYSVTSTNPMLTAAGIVCNEDGKQETRKGLFEGPRRVMAS